MATHSMIALFALVALTGVLTSNGLRCYVCSSITHSACEKDEDVEQSTSLDQSCGNFDRCYVTVNTATKVTTRNCATQTICDGYQTTADSLSTFTSRCCAEDNCNGKPSNSAGTLGFSFFLLPAILVALYSQFRL